MLKPRRSKTVCRYWVLIVLVLSLLDHAVSAQSNQQEKLDHSDASQGKQVAAGSTTDGNRYQSDYFDFTYSLPDGLVEGTEQYRSGIRALPGAHPNPDTFILLHADERANGSADPIGGITIMVDRLSRYPKGATEKDYIHHLVTKAMTDKGDELLQEGEEVIVSGKKFFRADYKVNSHPMSGYQTVMLTFQKGFALSWTFFAQSKTEVDSMTSSVQRTLNAK